MNKTITTEEGDRLIAEFMGATIDDLNNVSFILPADGKGLGGCGLHACRYHTSLDWLMPVVEKIEEGNYGFKMCRKVVEIYYDDSKVVILKTKEKSRIESLWLAVVQFIQWYNSQKQTS